MPLPDIANRPTPGVMMNNLQSQDLTLHINNKMAELEPHLITIRRDIHSHPELGFDTVRTADIVRCELEKMGYQPKTGVGRTGVQLDISGGAAGPTLLLRADMDALPMQEQTGLPYASQIAGKMHACGHDLHTATLLGVAATLKDLTPQLKGNVRLIFQPAEETAESGAAAMIVDGAADGIDMAITLHNKPELQAGRIALTRGASTASSDEFDVTVKGISTHAARPHMGRDPIIAAVGLITQLQTIISREADPADSAVLTIGHIQGGTTHNIIPDSCIFQGTVRARSAQRRDQIEAAFRRICTGFAQAMEVEISLNYQRGVPPLINDEHLIDQIEGILSQHFGERIEATSKSSFGAEDFSYFTERVPGCQIEFGSAIAGRHDHLHNSDYQPDEACIKVGAIALSRIAVDLLS